MPLFVLCLIGLAGAGCDSGTKVHAVQGQLLVAGQPAANASIAFHPLHGKASSAACPVGMTRSDGTYRLSTHATDDGAPPGEYAVTILWHDLSKPVDECECPNPADHDLLFGRYLDATTSPLHVTIQPKQNQILLRATPGPKPAPRNTLTPKRDSFLNSFSPK